MNKTACIDERLYAVYYPASGRFGPQVTLDECIDALEVAEQCNIDVRSLRVFRHGVAMLPEHDALHRTWTLTPLRDERIVCTRNQTKEDIA